MSEEKLEFKSGVTSTKQVRLGLIPHKGLLNAAERFELGIIKHGEKSWNNLKGSQDALKDTDWLIERCSHAIEHCYRMIDTLKSGVELINLKDDAGAVAWCGLVLGEAALLMENDLRDKNPTESYAKTKTVSSNLDSTLCVRCKQPFKPGDEVSSYSFPGPIHIKCPAV